MEKLKSLVLVSAGIVIVSMMLSQTGIGRVVAAGSAPVTVVNTAADPVPVTGNVTGTVSGTVNVGNFPATQNVGGTVNIGNTPTVNVGNFPAQNAVATTADGVTVPSLTAGATAHFNIGPIDASLITIQTRDHIRVCINCDFSGAPLHFFLGDFDSETRVIPLTQPLPVVGVRVKCDTFATDCTFNIAFVGS